jgi:hypothetical protein
MLCLPRKRVNSIRQLDDTRSNSIIKASFQPEIGVVNKPRFITIHHESTIKQQKNTQKTTCRKNPEQVRI